MELVVFEGVLASEMHEAVAVACFFLPRHCQ